MAYPASIEKTLPFGAHPIGTANYKGGLPGRAAWRFTASFKFFEYHDAMTSARDVLTPDALAMLQEVARSGSFAAAARQLGLVPSALTYRVRQIEEALDVLLFDRSSRQAKMTEAGKELLREGARLLSEIDAVANRVRRVATGWEAQLTIAADGLISRATLFDLAQAFFELKPPTRLRIRDEILSGTLQALASGQADLAIGVLEDTAQNLTLSDLQMRPLGPIDFVFAVAPGHPLAKAKEPLSDQMIQPHRAIAVADTGVQGKGLTRNLLSGQEVFTVPTMQAKIEAQLRGLGCGFVPEPAVRAHLQAGRLIQKNLERPNHAARGAYAWRAHPQQGPGRALQWWLAQLASPITRQALAENFAE